MIPWEAITINAWRELGKQNVILGNCIFTPVHNLRAYLGEANPMTNFSTWKLMCPKVSFSGTV